MEIMGIQHTVLMGYMLVGFYAHDQHEKAIAIVEEAYPEASDQCAYHLDQLVTAADLIPDTWEKLATYLEDRGFNFYGDILDDLMRPLGNTVVCHILTNHKLPRKAHLFTFMMELFCAQTDLTRESFKEIIDTAIQEGDITLTDEVKTD